MLTFAELAAALAIRHQIAAHKILPFQARLKNFHRLGFPGNIKTGRGVAAQYSAEDYLKMVIATELIAKGYNPSPVVAFIDASWSSMRNDLLGTLIDGCPQKTIYGVINLFAFDELSSAKRPFEFATLTVADLSSLLNGNKNPAYQFCQERMFLLDIGSILALNLNTLANILGKDVAEITTRLIDDISKNGALKEVL